MKRSMIACFAVLGTIAVSYVVAGPKLPADKNIKGSIVVDNLTVNGNLTVSGTLIVNGREIKPAGQIKEYQLGFRIAGTKETSHPEEWTNQFKANEKINSFPFSYPQDKKRIISAFIVPTDKSIDMDGGAACKRYWDLPLKDGKDGKNYFRITYGEVGGRLEMTPQEHGVWEFEVHIIYESLDP